MSDTKVVVRLLDAEGKLLGWGQTMALMREGALQAPTPSVAVDIDADGDVAFLSIHWCDINFEWRAPAPNIGAVKADTTINLDYSNDRTMLRVGPPASGLPAVTVRRRVTIDVPVGMLGAVGN